ncbi:unnamed protein product [marine sediment metagenome]|uniref:Uncharacterized protein n=1 Tax=marine sediment metagenome TaxID=412755 RepID=X1M534_9ZZZZ
MEQKAIPLDRLNCNNCGLFKEGKCSKTEKTIKQPEKYYCFLIFQNYKGGVTK